MTISFTNGTTEARMKKALSKMPPSLRPDQKEFVDRGLNSYIDSLVKDKVIPPC